MTTPTAALPVPPPAPAAAQPTAPQGALAPVQPARPIAVSASYTDPAGAQDKPSKGPQAGSGGSVL